MEFENEISPWNFLKKSEGGFGNISLVKNKIICGIKYDDLDTMEQESVLLNCLINYEKRIKGQVYFKDCEEGNKLLGVSLQESGEHFIKSLEFQRQFYNEGGQNLKNHLMEIRKKYSSPSEIKEFQKEITNKFYFMLPKLEEKFRQGLWDLH